MWCKDMMDYVWTWTSNGLDVFGRVLYHQYFKFKPILDWTWTSEGVPKSVDFKRRN